jgi:glucosamine--fructose-6-phosphate aminotransferase (isomerizing)
MNLQSEQYARFGLVRDMLAVPDIIRRFDAVRMRDTAADVRSAGRLLMTGEGSSRIFPSKSAVAQARRRGWSIELQSEAARQAQEYDLSDWAVMALSNSGRTAEVIGLFTRLQQSGHQRRFSLTAFAGSKLESLSYRGYVLECGPEGAVAATKSVIEQALFYRALLEIAAGDETLTARRNTLADAVEVALTSAIDPALIERISRAGTIYWAGRNDGVAEELTLKTNEITRRPADFLEGTYAVHGVEEVMNSDDIVLWVDPYPDSESKFREVLVDGVGLTVIAISSRDTSFPTIRIPDAGDLGSFVQMSAGWNVLVDVGLRLGVNLDQPQRARKVGNEFVG